jgi:hypothetical protein
MTVKQSSGRVALTRNLLQIFYTIFYTIKWQFFLNQCIFYNTVEFLYTCGLKPRIEMVVV